MNGTATAKSHAPAAREVDASPFVWLTRVAFGLSLAVVAVRLTMLEILRDPLGVTPGGPAVPRGPGPTTSLWLDLLAWGPALLVLGRGALDRVYVIRFTAAHALLAALAVWIMLSPLWADDKFAAVVSGFHLTSACVFLWAASHLIDSGRRLRIVAGLALGVLLVFGAQALNFRYIEQPELQRDWQANREARLRDRGMEPGSFAANQFEGKILRRETVGFNASSNSFAAVTVVLAILVGGLVVQRMSDLDGTGWIVLPLAGIGLGACVVVWADSKTAFVTPVLAAGAFAVVALAGPWLRRRATPLYAAGVAAALFGVAAVVGHGVTHGSLVVDSMTFRWRYWVGAARMFVRHPFLGVGWENFGQHYLAFRLPVAAEEVRDPHNFLVRFFSELGVVGGGLALAWVLRLAWDASRSRKFASTSRPVRRAMPALLALSAATFLLGVLAGVDLSFLSAGGAGGSAFVLLRVIERVVGTGLLLAGLWVATTRPASDAGLLDDRPAQWLRVAVFVALAVFCLHNLVDFSAFETGPMYLVALLAGAATAVQKGVGKRTPSIRRRVVGMAGMAAVWLGFAGAVAVPVALAEGRAAEADEFLRNRALSQAVSALQDAKRTLPYNADYAFREAQVRSALGPVERVREAFAAAASGNPSNAGYRFAEAAFEARMSPPDVARVRLAYEAGLALDPANVPQRLQFARTLESLGLPVDARIQYEKALQSDDALPSDDAERLDPAKREKIVATIVRLTQ